MTRKFCTNCGSTVNFTAQFCNSCGTGLANSLTGKLQEKTMLDGRYLIHTMIGQGGMGAVYKAVDTRIQGRVCAVKEMSILELPPEERQKTIELFEQEAKLLADLSHPSLPKVHDYFQEGHSGRYYLVMDFVEGDSLANLLERQGSPFPEATVRQWAVELCDVLTYLHSQSPPIIFRDLNPRNVMVDPSTGKLKMIDFGIARLFKPGNAADTQAFGSPGYAPPEQYGQAQTDARSDIYSLGVTILNLTTMHDPSNDPFNLPAARSLMPALSSGWEAVIQRAIQHQPDQRYQTAVEMRTALRGEDKETKKTPWVLIGGIVGVLMLFCMVAAFLIFRPSSVSPVIPTAVIEVVTATVDEENVAVVTPEMEETAVPEVSEEEDSDGLSAPVKKTAVPSPTTPAPIPTVTVLVPTTPAPTVGPETLLIGHSVFGEPLEVIKFGNGSNSILLVGGLHAGYTPGGVILAQKLIDHFKVNPDAIPVNSTLYILSSLNPDSSSAPSGTVAGRLNANGVDLNRNWGCNWAENTKVLGQMVNGGGGTAAFSEPETDSLKNFILDEFPKAVVFWGSQARGGMSSPGSCGSSSAVSIPLAQTYGWVAGYTVKDYETSSGEINGDATNWLDQQGIPAITILLPDHAGYDWSSNLAGVLAVLDEFSK